MPARKQQSFQLKPKHLIMGVLAVCIAAIIAVIAGIASTFKPHNAERAQEEKVEKQQEQENRVEVLKPRGSHTQDNIVINPEAVNALPQKAQSTQSVEQTNTHNSSTENAEPVVSDNTERAVVSRPSGYVSDAEAAERRARWRREREAREARRARAALQNERADSVKAESTATQSAPSQAPTPVERPRPAAEPRPAEPKPVRAEPKPAPAKPHPKEVIDNLF